MKPVRLKARLDEGTLSRYRLVDDEEWKEVAGGIEIPARSAAIVL